MKKIVSIVATVFLLSCVFCLFTACKDDNDGIAYTIEEKTYEVGDEFSTGDVVITAVKDGKKIKIDQNLKFDDKAVQDKLEDGKFTEKGEFTVAVYAVENRPDLKIGEWKITVKDKE